MSVRSYVKSMLLMGLIVISIGGLLLHSRIHPVSDKYINLIPAICGVLGIIVVPILFCFKKTIAYAYVINGFAVIIGTITMAHYSIANWPKETTLKTILFGTLLADILILWGKFFVGKAIFDLEFFGYDATKEKKGKTYRYPNMGWWLIHLVAVSIVYYLGNLLWR
jgi:hypothetical protein